MTPNELLKIREQIQCLEQQARGDLLRHLPVAKAVLEAAILLDKSIQPWCWGCGKLLLPTDYGDHLCNSCIGGGGLPIAYPSDGS